MRTSMKPRMGFVVAVALFAAVSAGGAWADGDETLAPPSIAIAPGSGGVMAGVGLLNTQPGTIDFNVPDGAFITQVLLYWYGRGSDDGVTGDSLVSVDGNAVVGTLIGDPTGTLPFLPSQAYRADITDLDLVTGGANSLSIEDLDFTYHTSGAGVIVIFIDASGFFSDIEILDGHDFGGIDLGLTGDEDQTLPQTYVFPSADGDRDAELTIFVADGEESRPDAVIVQVGANPPVQFNDVINATDGPEWNTLGFDVTIQALSRNDGSGVLPDSIAWIASTLVVPPLILPGECRMMGGGVNKDGSWDGSMTSGKNGSKNLTNQYTFGGQAGTPIASQPQPYGEWTHHQKKGPDGSFVFHAGTSSAPDGTMIEVISCADPDNCVPARTAPFKQLNFGGIGSFRNIKSGSNLMGAVAGDTFHAFMVHVEDLGEPGNNNRQKNPG